MHESVNVSATDSTVTDADVDDDINNSNVLIDKQKNDVSLTGCQKLAAVGKGNFMYRNGVLYRGDRILDNEFGS